MTRKSTRYRRIASGGAAALLLLAAALLLLAAAAHAREDAGASAGIDIGMELGVDDLDVVVPALPQAADAPRYETPDICEIVGTVTKVAEVSASRWNDGTPAIFAATEVRVTVLIGNRLPHGDSSAESCTLSPTDAREVTYKLCSPTAVAAGDRVHATEGMAPGQAIAAACLFDVAVLEGIEGAANTLKTPGESPD